MKIAYFVNHYPKVSHTFVRREILALERQGFDVQRIALRGWGDVLPDDEDRQEQQRTRYVLREGLRSLYLPTFRHLLRSPLRFWKALVMAAVMSRKSSERSLAYHLVYVAEACRLSEWLAEFGARHLHAHFGTNSAEVAMLARILGGPPFSFTVHGPDEFLRPMGLEEKIRLSAFVVAISSFGRSQLYLRCPYPHWSKVEVVHCGLEPSFYDVDPVPAPAAPRYVCVGRLTEAKGQLLLIEAVAALAAEGTFLELVLAGDGPMRPQIEGLIAKHALGDRVRITGWISSSDVRREILSARALVLPSFAEGLPVVIMEAMALGRPVISTYVAGIPELIRPGENGLLFPAGSVSDLVDALKRSLSMSMETARELGAAGRKLVIERHSIDTEAAKLGALFRNVGGLAAHV